LGVAYKRDVDDARESPDFTIIELLQKRGGVVSYHDPHIPHLPRTRHFAISMSSSPLTAEFLAAQDCVLIVTDHSGCDYDFVVCHAPLVVDTRNATRNVQHGREKICKA
jgi:UDP-N-acetyl-D-glucosamine dehydrogenase